MKISFGQSLPPAHRRRKMRIANALYVTGSRSAYPTAFSRGQAPPLPRPSRRSPSDEPDQPRTPLRHTENRLPLKARAARASQSSARTRAFNSANRCFWFALASSSESIPPLNSTNRFCFLREPSKSIARSPYADNSSEARTLYHWQASFETAML